MDEKELERLSELIKIQGVGRTLPQIVYNPDTGEFEECSNINSDNTVLVTEITSD